ncbi:shikimate dehydrogenase [Candidatus Peregrinibacteria bacterium]|nr:shikimate dehydrogenase [Candidatus Peregrinibacteria bacterium]
MKQYGILAYPAKDSLSPVIHNAAFKALELDAQYGVYEIPEEKLAEFMKTVKHEPIDGLSVSLPYKESIINFINKLGEDAEKIGAVNTINNKGGFLWGYNTDFIGAINTLKEAVDDLDEKTAVVLGAGGSARAVIYGLLKEGAHVWIKNRTKEKADQIAMEFAEMFGREVHSVSWEEKATGDILINATSFWVNYPKPEKLPAFCDQNFVDEFSVVMDISYNVKGFEDPLITPLLKVARKLGKSVLTGDKMLLYQAIEQFKIWTEKEPPVDVMRKSLDKAL